MNQLPLGTRSCKNETCTVIWPLKLQSQLNVVSKVAGIYVGLKQRDKF